LNRDDLMLMVKNQEDNFIERKTESVSTGELRQTLCAFANSVPEGRVGVLFIGVHDKTGEVLGVQNSDQLQKRIRDAGHGDCFPPIEYSSEVLSIENKSVLAVLISHSTTKPHFSGPAYVRVGSESPKANSEQYEELILSRIDKVREILKIKKHLITVLGVGYQLGSNKPLTDQGYKESMECRVEACTAHLVTLQNIASDVRFSEPVEHVTLNHDHKKNRPMLVVRFPKN